MRPSSRNLPDMAHFLAVPAVEPTRDVICLLRLDEEGVDNGMVPAEAVDWPERRPRYARAIQLLVRKQYVLPPAARDVWTPGLFEVLARERLRRGALLLGAARVVVTDRLHAVLLALLMGRRVVALDNFYGKIRRYSATWLSGLPGLYFAADMKEALQVGTYLGQTGP